MELLVKEALDHRAVNHPYLKALANGEFENMEEVLKDFASQYGFYSSWFPRYLTAVISKLENPDFRAHLLDNLSEESGHLHEEDMSAVRALGIKDEWIQGIPHPKLFKRFQVAMGVNLNAQPDIEVDIWRDSFLALMQRGSPASVVGAIGLGTESIVKYIYKDIITAIEKYTNLSLEDYVFFPLHTEVDDEHGLILLDIAEKMAKKGPEDEKELRKGMLKALDLRAAYWDGMYQRAKKINNQSVSGKELKDTISKNNSAEFLYDNQSTLWVRNEPILLSDYSARPFVLEMCEPLSGARVLDIGCGEGYVGRQLLNRGAACVHGIDISEKMIEQAKLQVEKDQLTHLTYESLDITKVIFSEDTSYDLVLGMFLFNYLTIEDMGKVMKKIYDVLEPGGHFVFSVPHPSLAFLKKDKYPFYFDASNGYFSGRNILFPGEIWRRDGIAVGVQSIHKNIEDYFHGLNQAGFTNFPLVHELHITDEHVKLDAKFFTPLIDIPLHLALKIKK